MTITTLPRIEIRHDDGHGHFEASAIGTFLRVVTEHGERDITPGSEVEDADDARFEARLDLACGELPDDVEVVDLRS